MKRIWFLCIALLLAQLAIATHGYEHLHHEDEIVCSECIALAAGMLALPAAPPRVASFAPAIETDLIAALPGPRVAPHPAFRSRAPPRIQST